MTDNAPALRVVVADDSVLLREGLVRVLDEAGFDVVAGYGDGDSMLAELEAARARSRDPRRAHAPELSG